MFDYRLFFLLTILLSAQAYSGPCDTADHRAFDFWLGEWQVWTDLAHDPSARTVSVRTYSAAWFDLMQALPELAPVLRKHETVVIAGAGLSLEVGTSGRVETFDSDALRKLVVDFRSGSAG